MQDSSLIDSALACALGELTPSTDAFEHWVRMGAVTMERVMERIEYHGIAALLNNRKERLRGWPGPLIEHVEQEARIAGLWEAICARILTELTDQLERLGVASVLMKGTALAYSLYEEPSFRRRGDIDLLIKNRDLEQTRAALLELGWSRNADDPHGIVFQEGWIHKSGEAFTHHLDLHWEPADAPILRKVLSRADYFENTAALDKLAPAARRPDLPITIIHCTLNQSLHRTRGHWSMAQLGRDQKPSRGMAERRLIWSFDFVLMMHALDSASSQRLLLLCTRHKLGPLVSETLRAAAGDLGASVPANLLEQLDRTPLDPLLAQYLNTTDSLAEFLLDLRTAPTLREQGKLLRDRMFAPRSHLLQKYPKQSKWPTLLLQVRSLIAVLGRFVKRKLL